MEFGKLIKDRRKELGKTQQDIANECNITFQSIGKWERGNSLPSADKIPALSKALQMGVSELLTGEKNDNEKPLQGQFDTQKFAKFLCELRTKSTLTQSQVAKQLFVTQGTIAKWESGKILPDIESLKSLCLLYGISVSQLYAYDIETIDVEGTKTTGILDNFRMARIYSQRKVWQGLAICLILIVCIGIVLSSVFISKLSKESKQYQISMSQLETDNANLQEFKQKYEQAMSDVKELQALASSLQTDNSNLQEYKTKYNSVIVQLTQLESEVSSLKTDNTNLLEYKQKYNELLEDIKGQKALTIIDEISEQSKTYIVNDSELVNLTQPQSDYYIFKGWNTVKDGSGESYNDSISVKADTILYAQWESKWIDKRVYGSNADKINEYFAKIENDLAVLQNYYDSMLDIVTYGYHFMFVYQQMTNLMSMSGIFSGQPQNGIFYLNMYNYIDELIEFVSNDESLNQIGIDFEGFKSSVERLSQKANSFYDPEDGQWTDEYKKASRLDYYTGYMTEIKNICDIMGYNKSLTTPYDEFVANYGGEFEA